MKKEIKMIEDRETLVYKNGNKILEISTDLIDSGIDGFCFAIIPENTKDSVAGVLKLEDLVPVLKENKCRKTIDSVFEILTLEILISVEEEVNQDFKTLIINVDNGFGVSDMETFEIPKDEIDFIINFCKEHM